MREPGHIYVLVNPSIEGLVKIGKTTRSPDERAKEISQATGVPTPFYAAYAIHVADCHSAEQHVYALLEHKGAKRSPNREFFEMPLRTAIEILLLAEKQIKGGLAGEGERVVSSGQSLHPGRVLLMQAADAFYGYNDTIKDRKEALRLLNQAKALNFPAAYTSLSTYYARWHEPEPDYEQALEILKEGARHGHGRCFVKMAEIYYDMYSHDPDAVDVWENVSKCWKHYFLSSTFRNDDDEALTGWGEDSFDGGIDPEFDLGKTRADYASRYLGNWVALGRIKLDPVVREILRPYRDDILNEIRAMVDYCQNEALKDNSKLERVKSWQDQLHFVQQTL